MGLLRQAGFHPCSHDGGEGDGAFIRKSTAKKAPNYAARGGVPILKHDIVTSHLKEKPEILS